MGGGRLDTNEDHYSTHSEREVTWLPKLLHRPAARPLALLCVRSSRQFRKKGCALLFRPRHQESLLLSRSALSCSGDNNQRREGGSRPFPGVAGTFAPWERGGGGFLSRCVGSIDICLEESKMEGGHGVTNCHHLSGF